MTELVVSVRDGEEAATAYGCGAAIIDLKEPLHGALGQPHAAHVVGAIHSVPTDALFSLACGELVEGQRVPALPEPCLARISWAKAGPSRLKSPRVWRNRFDQFGNDLPRGTRPVAVAYADFRIAKSLHPLDILAAAAALGTEGILLDTFCKKNGTLFDHLSRSELTCIMTSARRAGIWVALAGSITRKDLREATLLRSAYIAMRGGLCTGGRSAALSPYLVRSVQWELAALSGRPVPQFFWEKRCLRAPPLGGHAAHRAAGFPKQELDP